MMMNRAFSVIISVIFIFLSGYGYADEKKGFPRAEDIQRDLESAWQKIEKASNDGRFDDVTIGVEELSAVRNGLGLRNLAEYSKRLLEIAKVRAYKGEKERAFLLSGLALSLSPSSSEILLHSLAFDASVGFRVDWGKVITVIKSSLRDPLVAGVIVRDLSYPFLWAITLGVFSSILLFLVFEFSLIVKGVGKIAPFLRGRRGRVESATVILLLAPLCLGPLMTLFAWGIVSIRMLGVKAPMYAASSVTLLWVLVVPLREEASLNLQSEALLYLLTGESLLATSKDAKNLEDLVKAKPEAGPAVFSLAEVVRARGNLEKAEKLFSDSASLINRPALATANRAVIAYMNQEPAKARKLFDEAHAAEGKTAESLFNYSKVLFDLGKTTESAQVLEKVPALEKGALDRLQAIEESANEQGRSYVAEISLPRNEYFSLLFSSNQRVSDEVAKVLSAVGSGCGMLLLALISLSSLGVTYFYRPAVAPLSVREKAHPCSKSLKTFFRILPGGYFIVQHKLIGAMILFTSLWCAICGALIWPSSISNVASVAPELRLFSILFASFMIVVLGSFNYFASEEGKT